MKTILINHATLGILNTKTLAELTENRPRSLPHRPRSLADLTENKPRSLPHRPRSLPHIGRDNRNRPRSLPHIGRVHRKRPRSLRPRSRKAEITGYHAYSSTQFLYEAPLRNTHRGTESRLSWTKIVWQLAKYSLKTCALIYSICLTGTPYFTSCQ